MCERQQREVQQRRGERGQQLNSLLWSIIWDQYTVKNSTIVRIFTLNNNAFDTAVSTSRDVLEGKKKDSSCEAQRLEYFSPEMKLAEHTHEKPFDCPSPGKTYNYSSPEKGLDFPLPAQGDDLSYPAIRLDFSSTRQDLESCSPALRLEYSSPPKREGLYRIVVFFRKLRAG